MEEKKIIVNQRIKALNGEVENLIDSNEYIDNIESYETMNVNIKYRGASFTLNEETFLSQVGEDGWYNFYYDAQNDEWKRDTTNVVVDLADYGISVSGDIRNEDTIDIRVTDNQIEHSYMLEATVIFDNKLFNYISFFSTVMVGVKLMDVNEWYALLNTTSRYFEIDTRNTTNLNRYLSVYNKEKKDFTVKVVIAKKV